MLFIRIVIISFILLESTNVLSLYFFPDSKLANGIGIFSAWEAGKKDPEIHNFAKYMVNWVAGTKLIFILLLIVILLTGSEQTLRFTCAALILSIASFFWRLFPLIRQMDKESQLETPKYSLLLGWMIGGFILIFIVALLQSMFL